MPRFSTRSFIPLNHLSHLNGATTWPFGQISFCIARSTNDHSRVSDCWKPDPAAKPSWSSVRWWITVPAVILLSMLFQNQPRAQTTVVPAVGQSDGFNSISYSDDGQWIASGGGDGTAAIWDLNSGRSIRRFSGDTQATDAVRSYSDR